VRISSAMASNKAGSLRRTDVAMCACASGLTCQNDLSESALTVELADELPVKGAPLPPQALFPLNATGVFR
jgi:hypothetical protein